MGGRGTGSGLQSRNSSNSNSSIAQQLGWLPHTIQVGNISVAATIELNAFVLGSSSNIITEHAAVYRLPNGVKIAYKLGMDKNRIYTSPQALADEVMKIPSSISMASPTISVIDQANPSDSYWRSVYPNFTASAATGGLDGITIYKGAWVDSNMMAHEMGHVIDRIGFNKTLTTYTATESGVQRLSEGNIWGNLMQLDERDTGFKSVTKYGENSPVEDFAESIAYYTTSPQVLKRKAPHRYKFLNDAYKRY